MKKSLSLFKGLLVAAMLCISATASADATFYYRTFHVVAQNMTGNGTIYITTQTDPAHGEYQKFDTDLDAGFACTLSNGYGRLFIYATPDPGYAFQGVKIFRVNQGASEPTDDEVDAAPFAEYRTDETKVDEGVYSVMVFPGNATGETDEEKGEWSPYGVGGGKTFSDVASLSCNEDPDAYLYYYFADAETVGIHQVSNATASTPKVYGLDGREQNLSKGINIVRIGNTVRKVIIK